MKKILLATLLTTLSFIATAQFTGNSESGLYAEYLQNTKTRPAMLNLKSNLNMQQFNDYNSTEYQGSPFLNSDYIKGNIYFNGELHHANIPLRYNAFNDQFEIEPKTTKQDGTVIHLDKVEGIKVQVTKRSFDVLSYSEDGEKTDLHFFEALYLGSKVRLYKRNIQIYSPEKAALTSMTPRIPAKFTPSEVYYAMNAKGVLRRLPTSPNKFYKSFGEDKGAIKGFAKRYNINLKSEKDLKRLFTFYNTI